MVGLIILLLIVWLVLAVLGLIIKGILWLFFIGLVLFLGTAAWGWLQRRT